MIKQFIKDIGVYGFSGILVRMISFFLIPFYVRVLTTEDYGIIDLVTLVSAFSGVLLSLEIYQAIARFFPESEEKQKKTYASTGLFFYLFTYILFSATVIFFATPISNLVFNVTGKETILKLAVISILITSVFNYFQNLLRYSLKSVKYSISNILYSLTTILFSIFFVIIKKKGLEGVYLGQIVGGCAGLVLPGFFNLKFISFSIDYHVLKKMLKFSLPLVSSSLTIYALTYIDRIFIQRFLSLSELGIYGVSYRIASIPVVLMGIVNSSFVPLVYNKYKDLQIKTDLEKIYRIVFFIGFTVITTISIFSYELLEIITTPDYISAYKIMPFLLLSGFIMQFANMFLGLSITEKTKYIASIYLTGLMVSIITNILLIPQIGIMGAAITSSLVAVIILVIQVYLSQKYYYIEIKFKPYIATAILSAIMISIILIIPAQNSEMLVLMKIALAFTYFFICIRLIKIVRFTEIISFIKNNRWRKRISGT